MAKDHNPNSNLLLHGNHLVISPINSKVSFFNITTVSHRGKVGKDIDTPAGDISTGGEIP